MFAYALYVHMMIGSLSIKPGKKKNIIKLFKLF